MSYSNIFRKCLCLGKQKMIINKIYVDMDGVLADFDDGLRRLCGIEPMPQGNQPATGIPG